MRILNLCTLLPYPLIDGSRVAIYYPLKYLAARGHDITFVSLSDKLDPEAIRHMESICHVQVQQRSTKRTLGGALRYLFSSHSYDLGRFMIPEFQNRVIALAREQTFDVVEVALSSAWWGLALKRELGLPVVLRLQNVHWMNYARSIGRWKNPAIKLYLWNEGKKVRRDELAIVRGVDLTLTVSENDAEILRREDAGVRCRSVPAGVELNELTGERSVETPHSVLWMGSLGWRPNQDSFWWFYRSIVPEIVRLDPAVRITVVGSNPPPKIKRLRHPNVEVLGYVEDLQSVMRRSQVCVVPLKIGSGIRIKLLEMFAMRRAVVSTSIGCEGLGVEDGKELLVADEPPAFAQAVVRLLNDEALRIQLGDQARQHVERHYDWNGIAAQYEEAYRSVIAARTSAIRPLK